MPWWVWLAIGWFVACGLFAALVAMRAKRWRCLDRQESQEMRRWAGRGAGVKAVLAIAMLVMGLPALGVDQKIAVDPPRNADGTVLSDLAGIWIYWAPQRLAWTDDGKGNVTWGPVVTVGPTNRVWMPVGTYTVTVAVVAGPYVTWAVAVASYGAESEPAATCWRIGAVPTVKTRKAP